MSRENSSISRSGMIYGSSSVPEPSAISRLYLSIGRANPPSLGVPIIQVLVKSKLVLSYVSGSPKALSDNGVAPVWVFPPSPIPFSPSCSR